MRVDLFDYNLPNNLIADSPVTPRDHARLLVINRNNSLEIDSHFYDLPELLQEGDVLVLNNSRVRPARLLFEVNDKEVELFLIEQLGNRNWKCMVRPGKMFRIGDRVNLGEFEVDVVAIDDDGFREISFRLPEDEFAKYVRNYGKLPVPPYIKGDKFDNEDYNTVFAEDEGSLAAPTAGLHFTDELFEKLRKKSVCLEYITLEVGLGTFLPIKTADSDLHKMHTEKYSIDSSTSHRINEYLAEGRRIIAVGTTSVRVLEDNYGRFGRIEAGKFETNIFIKPGYEWKVVKGLITNFHLPKSTLLMLVSAFVGRERLLEIYEKAMKNKYRFYSFGDGMLII